MSNFDIIPKWRGKWHREMDVVKGCPVADRSYYITGREKPATMTMRLKMVQNQIKSQRIWCDGQPGDSAFPSITNVTIGSRTRISDHFNDIRLIDLVTAGRSSDVGPACRHTDVNVRQLYAHTHALGVILAGVC